MPQLLTQTKIDDFHEDTRSYLREANVLVPGGSGFIGSYVVEQLLILGANVTVISRQKKPRYLLSILKDIKLVEADLNVYDQIKPIFSAIDIVINMSAKVTGIAYNVKHSATMFHQNMQLFLNTIKAAQEASVPAFSVCSSACVYPRHCQIPTPESEGIVGEPEPTNSGYGWSKRMQEYLGQQYAKEFGMAIAIPRPYNAYGPRDNFDSDTSHVIPSLIHKAMQTEDGQFEVWGDGSYSRGFLHVDDFARGVIEASARFQCAKPINIGPSEEVTVKELAYLIAHEVSNLRGEAVTPKFIHKPNMSGQPRRCCDTTLARKELGYQSNIPLLQGIQQTIQWYIHNEISTLYSHV